MTADVAQGEPGERRYHHGDLRDALIAAGRAVLEEAGPNALTLREAARRAGVSHAAPRHHFPSLRHFLGDCAADGFAEFDATLRAAAAAGGDPAAALAGMARAYVGFARANRAMFRLMFDRDSFSERTEALQAAGARAYATLVAAVRSFDPAIDGAELDYRVATAWSIPHGFANLALEDHVASGLPAPEDLAGRAIADWLRGAVLPVDARPGVS